MNFNYTFAKPQYDSLHSSTTKNDISFTYSFKPSFKPKEETQRTTVQKLLEQYQKTAMEERNRLPIESNYQNNKPSNQSYSSNPYALLSTNAMYDRGFGR